MDANQVQQIIALLHSAADQSPSHATVREKAHKDLDAAFTIPTCGPILFEIARLDNLSEDLRLMAIVSLKILVQKYWKIEGGKGTTLLSTMYVVPEEAKVMLRQQLLSHMHLNSPRGLLNKQLPILIASIARTDFPSLWPTLLDEAVKAAPNRLRVLRELVAMLTSWRLPAQKRVFTGLAPRLASVLLPQAAAAHQRLLEALAAQPGQLDQRTVHEQMLDARNYVKILGWLMAYGLEGTTEAGACASLCVQLLPAWETARQALAGHAIALDVAERVLLALCKSLYEVLSTRPLVLPPAVLAAMLRHFYAVIISPPRVPTDDPPSFLERYLIHGLLCFKEVVAGKWLRPSVAEAAAHRAAIYSEDVFGLEKQLALTRVLVQSYFPLNQRELSDWNSSPEALLAEEETEDAWRLRIKLAADACYMVLIAADPALARAALHDILAILNATKLSPTLELPQCLLREAALRALQLGQTDFSDHFQLLPFWHDSLRHELVQPVRVAVLLRRRIPLLMAEWRSHIPTSHPVRPELYAALVALTHQSELTDLVVRVSACDALHKIINDFNFAGSDLGGLVDALVPQIFILISAVSDGDIKVRLLELLSVVIRELDKKVVPFVEQLVKLMTACWEDASRRGRGGKEEHQTLKSSIVRTLSGLATTLQQASPLLYPIVLPLIQYCTNVTSEDSVYLIEDGLDMWIEGLELVMQAAPQSDARLLSLYPNVSALIERSFELIEPCLKLAELYALVGGAEFLAAHQQALTAALLHIIGNVQDHSACLTLAFIELLMQRYTDISFLRPVFSKILAVMQKDIADKNLQPTMLVGYLGCFARLLLAAPQFFAEFFARAVQASPLPLFDLMLDNIDSVAEPQNRKLIALALCKLIAGSHTDPQLLSRVGAIVSLTLSVLLKVEGDLGYDFFVVTLGETGFSECLAAREKQQIYARDPVNTVNLRNHCIEQLQLLSGVTGEAKMREVVGESTFEQLLNPPPPPPTYGGSNFDAAADGVVD